MALAPPFLACSLLAFPITAAFAGGNGTYLSISALVMNPYFKVDITSAEEEEQQAAKFVKILNSLGEHASSYLFQKGVVLGDQSYMDFNRQLSDNRFRESIINSLLRPSEKNTDKDTLCLVAVMLFTMSKEATQLFLGIQAHPDQIGTRSAVIALGHLLALIDRATAFLNLPSINDKSYWRLMTLQPVQAPPVQAPPLTASPVPTPSPPPSSLIEKSPAARPPAPEQLRPIPGSSAPPAHSVLKKQTVEKQIAAKQAPEKPAPGKPEAARKPVTPPPTLDAPSPVPELSPIRAAKPKPKSKSKPTVAKQAKAVSDPHKPEGPLKAMVRRISEEIHDNSYEAIIEALKDETLMKDLYYSPNNPISVKITEVNTKERVVYLIKQKRGAPEPVTFRLIRKLIAELQ